MPPTKPTRAATALPAVDLRAIVEVNRRSVLAMTEMNRRMFRAMLHVHSELLGFTQRRLAEEAAAARMLAGCDEPETAMKIVQGFQARAFEDYAREAGEMVRLGAIVTGDLTREAIADLDDGQAE